MLWGRCECEPLLDPLCVRCIAGASGDAVETSGEKPEPPTPTRPDDLKGDWLWVSALDLWLLKYEEDQIFASYHDLPQVGGVSECRAGRLGTFWPTWRIFSARARPGTPTSMSLVDSLVDSLVKLLVERPRNNPKL